MLKIDKSFDDSGTRRTIFSRTSARFASGSVCMIMGKSGVGKSSLLNLISGIDLPDKGEIRVGDRCINTMTDTDRTLFRRRHIGFIYQFFNLIPVLTVLENVTLIMVTHSPDAAVWADQMFTVADRTLTPLKPMHPGQAHG